MLVYSVLNLVPLLLGSALYLHSLVPTAQTLVHSLPRFVPYLHSLLPTVQTLAQYFPTRAICLAYVLQRNS